MNNDVYSSTALDTVDDRRAYSLYTVFNSTHLLIEYAVYMGSLCLE